MSKDEYPLQFFLTVFGTVWNDFCCSLKISLTRERFTCSRARNKTDRSDSKKSWIQSNTFFFSTMRFLAMGHVTRDMLYYILHTSYCTVSIIICWIPYRTDPIRFKWILHIGSEQNGSKNKPEWIFALREVVLLDNFWNISLIILKFGTRIPWPK